MATYKINALAGGDWTIQKDAGPVLTGSSTAQAAAAVVSGKVQIATFYPYTEIFVDLATDTVEINSVNVTGTGAAAIANKLNTEVFTGGSGGSSGGPITATDATISGVLKIGNGSFSALNDALIVNRNLTAINNHAFRDESTVSSSVVDLGYAGFDGQYTMSGTVQYNHAHGFQARHIYTGAGTLNNWSGFYVAPVNNGTGTITNVKGLNILNATGSGPITNQYGIYIEALTKGATSNHPIYSLATGTSWLSGRLDIGITANTNGTATTDGQLALRGYTGNKMMQLGYNTTGNYGWLQAANYGSAYSPIILNPNGGNVTIGSTTTPTASLTLPAGTTSRAPLRLTSGVAPTTPNDGDIWFDGTNLKMRKGGATYTLTMTAD